MRVRTMRLEGEISTDTATICVFDLAAMAHRKYDIGDWWSIPSNRVVEIQKRNALFIELGDDGTYQVAISSEAELESEAFCLATPSGSIFIGPGEEMSGGDFEPDGKWGGYFMSVEGPYQSVRVRRNDDFITIDIRPSVPFENEPLDCVALTKNTAISNDR